MIRVQRLGCLLNGTPGESSEERNLLATVQHQLVSECQCRQFWIVGSDSVDQNIGLLLMVVLVVQAATKTAVFFPLLLLVGSAIAVVIVVVIVVVAVQDGNVPEQSNGEFDGMQVAMFGHEGRHPPRNVREIAQHVRNGTRIRGGLFVVEDHCRHVLLL